jgi:hypothetical protein
MAATRFSAFCTVAERALGFRSRGSTLELIVVEDKTLGVEETCGVSLWVAALVDAPSLVSNVIASEPDFALLEPGLRISRRYSAVSHVISMPKTFYERTASRLPREKELANRNDGFTIQ